MTKRLVVVLGLLVAVVALVAATAQAGHKAQKVTNVTFAGWSSGPEEDALDQQMANAFNKSHPSIHVSWTVINGNYGDAMTARFAAHNPPEEGDGGVGVGRRRLPEHPARARGVPHAGRAAELWDAALIREDQKV